MGAKHRSPPRRRLPAMPPPDRGQGSARADAALQARAARLTSGPPTSTTLTLGAALRPTAVSALSGARPRSVRDGHGGPCDPRCGEWSTLTGTALPPPPLPTTHSGLGPGSCPRHLPEGLQQDAELLSTAQRKHRDQHLWGQGEGRGGAPGHTAHPRAQVGGQVLPVATFSGSSCCADRPCWQLSRPRLPPAAPSHKMSTSDPAGRSG